MKVEVIDGDTVTFTLGNGDRISIMPKETMGNDEFELIVSSAARGQLVVVPNSSNTVVLSTSEAQKVLNGIVAESAAERNMDVVRAAMHTYHLALDNRQHGGVAAGAFVQSLEHKLGMSWKVGAAQQREEKKKKVSS